MAVLDLTRCPICHARDSLARQTTQLESRTHVAYECLQCGTLLAWLGDDMWLEADRWSFQKVGRPENANLLYRSMTVAELRKLAGEKPPPYPVVLEAETRQAKPPPTWIDLAPSEEEQFDKAPLAATGMAMVADAAEEPGAAAAGDVSQEEPAADEAQQAAAQQAAAQEPQAEASFEATVVGAVALARENEPAEQAAAQPADLQPADLQPADLQPADLQPADLQPAVLQAPSEALVQAESPAPDDAQSAGPPPTWRSNQRRRSRGSPFLIISVGLVLLCLICSAAAMIVYSMLGNWPVGVVPSTNPTASEVMPTETPVPTDTPAPTATPSAMPTEAAPPGTAGRVEFQGVTDYLSSTGSHYLVGEVLNRTADTLRFVEVLATFYDANGQLVGTGSTFTELSIIEPGSTAPFKLTTLDPPAVGHYDLRVDYATTTQPPIRLEIRGHSGSVAGTGWYHVTGEVRNPHDFAVKFPEIVATYYNATHDAIRVEVDFAEAESLEPGQTSPFEVVLTDPPADLQHYALQTEAVQK